jgi:hypothetical protein
MMTKMKGGSAMQEFFNPKSMITPGIAGSLMMFLVNGIACQFPELSPRYLALFFSFLIGSVVWFSKSGVKLAAIEKTVYWILNSLVIFVVGFGSANLAADVTVKESNPVISSGLLLPMVSTAFAQTDDDPGMQPPPGTSMGREDTVAPNPQNPEVVNEELERARAENERLKRQLETIQKEEKSKEQQRQQQFFKKW